MNKITTDKNIVASISSKEEKQKKTLDGSHFYKAKHGSHVDEAMVKVVELTPMLFRKAVSLAVTKDKGPNTAPSNFQLTPDSFQD